MNNYLQKRILWNNLIHIEILDEQTRNIPWDKLIPFLQLKQKVIQ